ncbi:hypothetical protein GCM10007921_10590 [Tritonibacter mobilis]|nr:hypothetical protein GCM10007921_10590 [Tritonibacter mobilis]
MKDDRAGAALPPALMPLWGLAIRWAERARTALLSARGSHRAKPDAKHLSWRWDLDMRAENSQGRLAARRHER